MKIQDILFIMIFLYLSFASYGQITSPEYGGEQRLVLTMNEDRIEKIKPYRYDPEKPYSYAYSGRTSNQVATMRLLEGDDFLHLQVVLNADDNSQNAYFRFGLGGVDAQEEFSIEKFFNVRNGKVYYTFFDFIELGMDTDVIDLYYDHDIQEYQLQHNGEPIACGDLAIEGIKQAFVTADNGDNVNTEVLVSIAPEIDLFLPCSSACEAVDELAEERLVETIQEVETYPNPARDYLTLELHPFVNETITINMLDATGRIALRQTEDIRTGHTTNIHLNTQNLTAGVYYLNIQSDYKFETQKITILN